MTPTKLKSRYGEILYFVSLDFYWQVWYNICIVYYAFLGREEI